MFLDFSVDEYRQRLERIHGLMEEQEIDGLLLSMPTNLIYSTGYRTFLMLSGSRPFLAVVPQGKEPVLILPNLEVGSARKTSWVKDIRGWGSGLYADKSDVYELLADVLKENNLQNGRLGIELGHGQRIGMTLEEWDKTQATAPDVEWVDAGALMWAARMVKSEREIEYLRVTCQAADAGFMSAYAAAREGVVEREVTRALAMGMLGAGADTLASLITSSGLDRYDMINPYATDRKLKSGEQMIFDFGCWYRGYRSDITRWFYIGEPSEEQRRNNDAALEIYYDTLEAVKPGNTAADVDKQAYNAIVSRGYKEYMLHRTGHALGLDVHERPSLGPGDNTVLQPGMVIAVEPGIYDFSVGAWRMEDNILITEDGYEFLTNAPRNILVV